MTNTELVGRFYQTARSGDYDALAHLCDPELEWIQNDGFPYGGRHRGVEQVVANVYRTLARHWDGFAFAIHETLDAGDSVVVLGEYSGRHRQTGKSFRAAAAHVLVLKAGRVRRFLQYTDTALIRDAASP